MSWGATSGAPKGFDDEFLPPDALGVRQKVRRSPFKYTAGNEMMMKEYGMTEEEFADEFGGRPHQQRQSPVSRIDLHRLRINQRFWDYCSHRYIPFYYCWAGTGLWASLGQTPDCKHYFHEWELCQSAEAQRQNQVLGIKKKAFMSYTAADKNWLFNDQNWGHLLFRSLHTSMSVKSAFMLGGSSRVIDSPSHEMTMQQNPKYNPEQIRAEPHPLFHLHKIQTGSTHGFKFYWNKFANHTPLHANGRSPHEVLPFDPLMDDGSTMKPW
eukprot:TRINITY_DN39095_c0_g1_i1.p2 TRINITY_DN39095_c0_g1~~TRINITY_DN39095_c0_g1_i1.p2  ORF type:complete len:268 (+),score=76.75 TRINITY_DN39095_c0_g1_i1:97-900(+)